MEEEEEEEKKEGKKKKEEEEKTKNKKKKKKKKKEKKKKKGEGWAQHAFNTRGWFLRGDSAPWREQNLNALNTRGGRVFLCAKTMKITCLQCV
ncbi:hypothetical protein M8J75_001880 [Diaphorina citri]|nr:hypothetical protein M8J75_001880 [Diaphorina citri]